MSRNIILNPQQKKIVEMDVRGTLLIKGVAGSGKSTLAVRRALAIPELLSRQNSAEGQSNLFSLGPLNIAIFTYNRVLARYLSSMLSDVRSDQTPSQAPSKEGNDGEAVNIYVNSVYRHAWKYFGDRGYKLMEEPEIFNIVGEIVRGSQLSGALKDIRIRFFCDEFKWIKGMQVHDLDEYLQIRRKGREIRLGAEERKTMWDLYDRFKKYQNRTKRILYEDYPNLALKRIDKGEWTDDPEVKLFDAILIDEAQDLSKASLKFLSALAKPGLSSVTILADAAQSIYQNGITWKDAGFKVQAHRSVELKTNFRSNPAISRVARCVAEKITDRDDLLDIELNLQGENQTELPEIIVCQDPHVEMRIMVSIIRKLIRDDPDSSVGVLYMIRQKSAGYAAALGSAGINLAELRRCSENELGSTDRIFLSTMHSAKGLEFDHVILADVNESIFKSFDADDPEVGDRNRRLLYTAMTRARRSLHILTSDLDYSRILDDIEPDFVNMRTVEL